MPNKIPPIQTTPIQTTSTETTPIQRSSTAGRRSSVTVVLLAGLLAVPIAVPLVTPEAAASDAPAPDAPAAGTAVNSDALAATDRAYNAAAALRDRDGLAALLADDAVFFAESAHRGRDAFLAGWEPLWTAKYDFSYSATTLEATIAASGDLGYALGAVTTRFQPPGLDEATVTESHYLNIWRHTDEDGWRLAATTALVVHPRLGAAREPRAGLMTAWPRLADQVESTIALEWTPHRVESAASGELKVVSGSYTARFDDGDSEQNGSGSFVAVWQRAGDGHWQLAAEGYTPPELETNSADGAGS